MSTIEKEYNALRTSQNETIERFKKIDEDLSNWGWKLKFATYAALSAEIEEGVAEFNKLHKQLKALAEKDTSLLTRVYFVDNSYEELQKLYEDLFEQLHAIEMKATLFKSKVVINVDESINADTSIHAVFEEIAKDVYRKENQHGANENPPAPDAAANGMNNAVLEKLCETISNGQNRHELKFPTFPADISLFFD